MKQPALVPVNYFFPEVFVKASESFNADGNLNGSKINLTCEAKQILENGDYFIQLRFATADEESDNAPYSINIVCCGNFRAMDGQATDGAAEFLFAATLIIGATREFIATLTGRGPWPRFILPAIVLDITAPAKSESQKIT